jgi:hypothetical protein
MDEFGEYDRTDDQRNHDPEHDVPDERICHVVIVSREFPPATLRVLVWPEQLGARTSQAMIVIGENVTSLKHGFEPRWGHHGDFVGV